MTQLDDITVMAYVDNQLTDGERLDVEALAAKAPEIRARIDQARTLSASLKSAFDAPMHAPPPDALVAAIMSESRDEIVTPLPPVKASADVISFRRRITAVAHFAMPLAACAAFLAGLGLGAFVPRSNNKVFEAFVPGLVQQGSHLATLLEQKPTGDRLMNLQVVATFKDRNNRACREVEQLVPGDPSPISAAIACRQPGGWLIEGTVRLGSAAGAQGGFTPSSAPTVDLLEGMAKSLGASKVLTSGEERQLIDGRWGVSTPE